VPELKTGLGTLCHELLAIGVKLVVLWLGLTYRWFLFGYMEFVPILNMNACLKEALRSYWLKFHLPP
jgi:hypothetical protein